jgi:alanine racemase
MPRPIRASLDLSALEHNLRIARRATRARVMAVLKASAYGHGLLHAAAALEAADGFALLDVKDAITLREAGYRQVILLLEGFFCADEVQLAAAYDLACVIHNSRQLALLDAYPRRGSLQVWLKINTGMNRLGFAPQDVPEVMEKLKAHPAISEITLMTHFAQADEAAGVDAPLELFNTITAPYRVARSLANSAALLRYRSTHAEWVRPGIMLYGISPFADTTAQQLSLRPVMTLCSEIIGVQTLRSGDTVGYGAAYTAETAMRIGTVACGYADGYPRHAPSGTPVRVTDRLTRTVGRVSMDMLCVDISALPDAGIGSKVVLWGEGLPIEEVARAAGTISYELLCALAARVPVES